MGNRRPRNSDRPPPPDTRDTSLRCVTDNVSVDLSGAAQTMLTTLYLKALDADFDRPVLGDRYAKEVVSRLDYDFREAVTLLERWLHQYQAQQGKMKPPTTSHRS